MSSDCWLFNSFSPLSWQGHDYGNIFAEIAFTETRLKRIHALNKQGEVARGASISTSFECPMPVDFRETH